MRVLLCLLLLLFSLFVESDKCTDGVCFTWKVSAKRITLICKVGKLDHRITIINTSGQIQADCLPTFPNTTCDHHFKNTSIWQNKTSNETFCTVDGQIDYHVNGNWTCKHGTGLGVAIVEVTVLKVTKSYVSIYIFSQNIQSGEIKYQHIFQVFRLLKSLFCSIYILATRKGLCVNGISLF